MAILEIKNLSKKYHYDDYSLFDDITLSVDRGEFATFLIETQSGKTTLGKILTGVTKYNGSVQVDGKEISQMRGRDKGVCVISAQPMLFNKKSVRYNLSYPLLVRKVNKKQIEEQIRPILDGFPIGDDTRVDALTRQQRFTLSLLRGRMVERKLIVYDGLNAEQLEQAQSVFCQVGLTKILLTDQLDLMRGKVFVVQNKVVAYSGDAAGARGYLSDKLWLG